MVQETVLIRTLEFTEAVGVRERAAPLVEKLCQLAEDPVVAALRPRLDGLLERSAQNHHFLETQLGRLQDELNRVTDARNRLRQVAPAYRPVNAGRRQSRLNAR